MKPPENAAAAKKWIRAAAMEGRYWISKHAEERMAQRQVSVMAVGGCLRVCHSIEVLRGRWRVGRGRYNLRGGTMKRKCDCGGQYKSRVVERHDVSKLLGFDRQRVVVRDVRAWVCGDCGHVAIDGAVLEVVAAEVALWICRRPQRLTGEQARFLRETLGVAQRELGDRLGINRVTVAKWESGALPISPQHDYMLRGHTLAAAGPELAVHLPEIMRDGVHSGPPPAGISAAVIEMAKGGTRQRARPESVN